MEEDKETFPITSPYILIDKEPSNQNILNITLKNLDDPNPEEPKEEYQKIKSILSNPELLNKIFHLSIVTNSICEKINYNFLYNIICQIPNYNNTVRSIETNHASIFLADSSKDNLFQNLEQLKLQDDQDYSFSFKLDTLSNSQFYHNLVILDLKDIKINTNYDSKNFLNIVKGVKELSLEDFFIELSDNDHEGELLYYFVIDKNEDDQCHIYITQNDEPNALPLKTNIEKLKFKNAPLIYIRNYIDLLKDKSNSIKLLVIDSNSYCSYTDQIKSFLYNSNTNEAGVTELMLEFDNDIEDDDKEKNKKMTPLKYFINNERKFNIIKLKLGNYTSENDINKFASNISINENNITISKIIFNNCNSEFILSLEKLYSFSNLKYFKLNHCVVGKNPFDLIKIRNIKSSNNNMYLCIKDSLVTFSGKLSDFNLSVFHYANLNLKVICENHNKLNQMAQMNKLIKEIILNPQKVDMFIFEGDQLYEDLKLAELKADFSGKNVVIKNAFCAEYEYNKDHNYKKYKEDMKILDKAFKVFLQDIHINDGFLEENCFSFNENYALSYGTFNFLFFGQFKINNLEETIKAVEINKEETPATLSKIYSLFNKFFVENKHFITVVCENRYQEINVILCNLIFLIDQKGSSCHERFINSIKEYKDCLVFNKKDKIIREIENNVDVVYNYFSFSRISDYFIPKEYLNKFNENKKINIISSDDYLKR